MDVGAALVADEQTLEVVQPREGALDDPAQASESGAVRLPAPGDHGCDPASSQLDQVVLVVIGAVGEHALGSTAWPSGQPAHRGDAVEQRDQLQDVVAVAGAQPPGERKAIAVDEEMVLGARTPAIDRARARFGAPFFACT